MMDIWFNNNYSPPLQDAKNTTKSNKNSCLKYTVALQCIAIIIMIVAYSKQDSLTMPSNDATNTAYNTDGSDNTNSQQKSPTLDTPFPFRNQYCADPIGIISELIGRWYGDTGVDTVFGIKTYYTEFITFEPLTYGVINRAIPGEVRDGEQVFGVRFFRQVISNAKNDADHPFPPSAPIHEETGYILFMFISNNKGNKATFARVVKSLAIPRGQTVLAEGEYTDCDCDGCCGNEESDVKFDSEKNIVEYIVRSGDSSDNENAVIGNGDFTNEFAFVPSFIQSVKVDLNNHIFAYNESSPIILNGEKTEHMNMAILTKLNI